MDSSPIDTQAFSSDLDPAFSGHVILPGDDHYEQARRVHNGLIDKRPGVILQCLSTADVCSALRFGIDNELEIAVRGGGHNVAGRAVCDDGLVIDLSLMKGMHTDVQAGVIRVQPGVTWGEFNRETELYGLATTGGMISSTGVAGLTLGGAWARSCQSTALPSITCVPHRSSRCPGASSMPANRRMPICSGPFAAAAATSAS